MNQRDILRIADHLGKSPTKEQMKFVPGFHFCPDWDYMAICNDSPEKETCSCELREGIE